MSRSTHIQRKTTTAPAGHDLGHRETPATQITATQAAGVQSTLDSSGAPLDHAVQEQMSAGFGADFSQVRIHTDDRAAGSARALDARAYTLGNTIAFGAGEYAPHTDTGQRLIAHELAHVAQQSSSTAVATPPIQRMAVSQPADPLEQAADAAAEQVLTRKNWASPTRDAIQPPHTQLGGSYPLMRQRSPVPTIPTTIFRKATKPPLSLEQAVVQAQGDVSDADAESEPVTVDLPANDVALADGGDAAQAGAGPGGGGGGGAAPTAPAAEPSEATKMLAAQATAAPSGAPPVDTAAPVVPAPGAIAPVKPDALQHTPKAPPAQIAPVPVAAAPVVPAIAPAATPATVTSTAKAPSAEPDAATQPTAANQPVDQIAPTPAPQTAPDSAAPVPTSPAAAATPAQAPPPPAGGTAQMAANPTAPAQLPPPTGDTAQAPSPTAGTVQVDSAGGRDSTAAPGQPAAAPATPMLGQAAPTATATTPAAPANGTKEALPKTADDALKTTGPVPGAAPTAAANAPAAQANGTKEAPGAQASGSKEAPPKPADEAIKAAGPAPADGSAPAGAGQAAPAPANVAHAPASAAEDPGFHAVAGRARAAGAGARSHAPAGHAAGQAQAAADPQGSDVAMAAQDRQVDAIHKQPAGEFNPDAFKAKLMEKIEQSTPKTLKDADEFGSNNRLGEVKGEVGGQIKDQKQHAVGPVEEKASQAPDPSGIQPKAVQPVPPPAPGAPPAPLGGAAAAPKPKTDAEVAAPLAQQSQSLDQQMTSASVTDDQLRKSNEPSFVKAADAKHEAQSDAAAAPQHFRQQEGGALAGAQADAAATADQQAAVMRNERTQLLAQVFGMQGEAKAGDETERRKVAEHIAEIYQKTKTDAEKILSDLDGWVEGEFTRGADQAQQTCVQFVKKSIEDYKDKRYSGLGGPLRWLDDILNPLPPETQAFYDQGRELYLSTIGTVLTGIAQHVAAELDRAKARVAQGRQEIQDYVKSLPASLQQVGQQAAGQIQGKFDELEQNVNAKQDELIDSLAQNYNDKLQEVNEKLEAIKRENSGLINKAKDLIGDTIGKILEMKAALESTLARATGAIMQILKDPIGFLGNLLEGVKQGFLGFISRIGTHLQQGLMNWLTGSVAAAGLRMPAQLDLPGIFDLVLQLLGLTWDNIRAQLVRALGPRGEEIVSALEKAWEVIQIIRTKGLAGLWEYVQGMIGDLKAMVIGEIERLIGEEVLKAGIQWLIGILGGPAGAFIKAVQAIIKVVSWFMNNASRIMGLINAIVDSVSAIASGALGQAAEFIEGALARSVPILIGFLADLLGLGNIAGRVRDVIAKVRAPIGHAIEWLVGKAKALGKKILGFLKGGRGGAQNPTAVGAAGQDKQARWDAGITAVKGLPPESEEQIGPALGGIKQRYGFDELRPVSVEDHWQVHAVMRMAKGINVNKPSPKPNLTLSKQASEHILMGNTTGGAHAARANLGGMQGPEGPEQFVILPKPGKSYFDASLSDDDILNGVIRIANDPTAYEATKGKFPNAKKRNSQYHAIGYIGKHKVKVVVEPHPEGKGIITAYPVEGT